MLNYDFAECRRLAEEAPRNDSEFKDAIKYFHDRVFLTDNGTYYYYKNGNLVRETIDNFRKSKMMGFPKKFIDQINKTTCSYDEVLETKNYTVDKEARKINAFRQIRAFTLNDVKVGKAGQEYVEHVKKFMFEISANGRQKLYELITKWFASVIQLKRTKICLVFVTSTEGVGKTTLSLILEAVLGEWNTAHPSAEEMKRFHWQCYGKILVVFEETEGLRNDSGAVSDNLKNMINSDTFAYEAKGVQVNNHLMNINNIIVTSNFPLPNSSGRRYLNVTPSTKWLGEFAKFEQLCNFTDENVKALYDYFMSIDVSDWNAEKAVRELDQNEPNLKAIETMNNAFRFMRDYYAHNKQDEKIRTKDLYDNYKARFGTKAYQKSTFFEKVSELNIPKKTHKGYDYFIIDGEELYKEFDKRRLIDKDLIEDQEKDVFDVFDVKQNDDNAVVVELKQENQSLKIQLDEMKKQLQEMKKMLTKSEEPVEKNEEKPIELGKKVIKVKANKSK